MLSSLVRDSLVVKIESFVLRAIQLYKFVDINGRPVKHQITAFLKITFLVKRLIFIPPGVVAMHCVDLWQQRKFKMENQRQRHEAWKKLIELWRTGKDGSNDEELEVFKRHGIDPQRYIDDEKDENKKTIQRWRSTCGKWDDGHGEKDHNGERWTRLNASTSAEAAIWTLVLQAKRRGSGLSRSWHMKKLKIDELEEQKFGVLRAVSWYRYRSKSKKNRGSMKHQIALDLRSDTTEYHVSFLGWSGITSHNQRKARNEYRPS